MLRTMSLASMMVMAAGCPTNSNIRFEGDNTWEFFPFEGYRKWTYVSEDTSLPYMLVAETADESELLESGTRVYTVNFRYDCVGAADPCIEDLDADGSPDLDGTLAWSWRMSASSIGGVLIHELGGASYDPPVQLADSSMFKGDSVVTESGGTTYTSTYVEQNLCPAPYWRGSPPDECALFRLEDGGAGSTVAGEFWSIYQFNIVAFTFEGEASQWQLRDYEDEL
jgi:hypothetical protein